jgi:diguanylate cyclase (GGDEF)-like protein
MPEGIKPWGGTPLRENVESAMLLVDQAPVPMLRLTMEGVVIYANDSAKPVLSALEAKVGGSLRREFVDLIFPYLSHAPSFDMEFPIGSKTLSLVFCYLRDANCVNVYGMDITERRFMYEEMTRKRSEAQALNERLQGEIKQRQEAEALLAKQRDAMQRMAQYDSLTGLPNRALYTDRMKLAMEGLKRDRFVGMMMIDLDGFKSVNDDFGHDAGDAVLVETARRLERCCRSVDTAARMGGDEFCILFGDMGDPTIKHEEVLTRIAQNIVDTLGEPVPFVLDGRRVELKTTPSIGIAIARTPAVSMDALMKQADIAMYFAKNSGKNAYRFYERS